MERHKPNILPVVAVMAIASLITSVGVYVTRLSVTGLESRVVQMEGQPIIITVKVYPQPGDKPVKFTSQVLPAIDPTEPIPASVQKFLNRKAAR